MDWKEKQKIHDRADKQLENINSLIEKKKYHLARREAIKLSKKYPNFWKVNNKIVLLNHLIGDDSINIEYLNEVLQTENKSSIKSCLFESYYFTYQFEKAFELLDYFMDSAKENKIKNYRLYEVIIMKKLGMNINLLDFEKNDPVLNQIINYNERSFMSYMHKKIENYEKDGNIINPSVDLDDICNIIAQNIVNYKRSKQLSCFDIYHVEYRHFSWNNNDGYKDILLVKTIPQTSQIISIKPESDAFVDIINKLQIEQQSEFKSQIILKKKTQIEKFYSRYSK